MSEHETQIAQADVISALHDLGYKAVLEAIANALRVDAELLEDEAQAGDLRAAAESIEWHVLPHLN